MKLAYERPVMRAELFQTNAYCASSCTIGGDTSQSVGMNAVRLGDAVKWFKVPSAGTDWDEWVPQSHDSAYTDLVFGGVQKTMTGTGGATQYYWSTTVGGKTYHLEYSAGWTDKWDDLLYNGEGGIFGSLNPDNYDKANPDYSSGDKVFVLYEEITKDTELDACVSGYDGGYFPGSDNDQNPNYWGGAGKYDDAIYQFVFNENQIRSYWS